MRETVRLDEKLMDLLEKAKAVVASTYAEDGIRVPPALGDVEALEVAIAAVSGLSR